MEKIKYEIVFLDHGNFNRLELFCNYLQFYLTDKYRLVEFGGYL